MSTPPPATPLHATLQATLPDGRLWPCTLHPSPKARRCRLRVDARGMATLVVPTRSRHTTATLQSLLDSLTPWLHKTLCRLLGPDAAPPDPAAVATPPELPASLSLPVSGLVWHIYVVHRAGRATLREEMLGPAEAPSGGRLLLSGPTDDPGFISACCLLLQRWLRTQGARWLPPRLRMLAGRMGAEVGRITVRAQRGRWGSCSSRGDISLNCLLVLLPLPLLDHVCVHELCHLRHMDHSRRYRDHLAQHAPQWKWREKALDDAWRHMPRWALWREK